MIFPSDFVSQYVPRGSTSPGVLELENVFEDHGVSRQIIDEMFALEVEAHRRCFLLAQPVLFALQRYNRRKCAPLLRGLTATADLPHNSAFFSQQLLDLTHRWSEREDNDIDIGDVHRRAAAVPILFKLHSARHPDPVPYQFPDPQQPRWPTCSQPLLHSSPGARPTMLHCCTQLGQLTKLSQRNIVSWCQSKKSFFSTRQHWFLPSCSRYC